MRVLITGAMGLIGQEIVMCCHESGIQVVSASTISIYSYSIKIITKRIIKSQVLPF